MRNHPLFMVLLMLVPFALQAQDGYYTKNTIIGFADFLYQSGDYERAIGEYKRALSLGDGSELRDSLYYRIASAYGHLSKPPLTRKFCAAVIDGPSAPVFAEKARCLAAFSYYAEKKYDSSLVFVSNIESVMTSVSSRNLLARIKVASLLQQYRWDEAVTESENLVRLFPEQQNDSSVRSMLRCGQQGAALRLKSPAVAGIMSSLVPGSGKIYAHRAWDGFYSLLIVGAMAWQSYEGFSKDGESSIRGATFGLLAFAFYSGNIYGSVNAARQYNNARRSALAGAVDLEYPW